MIAQKKNNNNGGVASLITIHEFSRKAKTNEISHQNQARRKIANRDTSQNLFYTKLQKLLLCK